jgi:hypothetical protein
MSRPPASGRKQPGISFDCVAKLFQADPRFPPDARASRPPRKADMLLRDGRRCCICLTCVSLPVARAPNRIGSRSRESDGIGRNVKNKNQPAVLTRRSEHAVKAVMQNLRAMRIRVIFRLSAESILNTELKQSPRFLDREDRLCP